jgi:hypothetical protein
MFTEAGGKMCSTLEQHVGGTATSRVASVRTGRRVLSLARLRLNVAAYRYD